MEGEEKGEWLVSGVTGGARGSASCGRPRKASESGGAETSAEKDLLGAADRSRSMARAGLACERHGRAGNGGRASARAQSERAPGEALGRRGKGKEETLILEANFGVGRAQGLVAMEMDGVVADC